MGTTFPFIMRKFSSALLVLSLFVSSVSFPSSVLAKDVDRYFGASNGDVVSRGEFIRASIELLNLENTPVDESEELPYRRIAKALKTHVRIAHQKKALVPFGFDLLLAQGITRGEALQMLVNLTGYDTATPAPFNDARVGTPEERAVRVAIDKGWMQPLRDNFFGVRRKLTMSDGRLLMRNVLGEGGVQQKAQENKVQTVKVKFESNKRLYNLPKTQIMEAIWSLINNQYLYDEKVDTDEAAYSAIEGIVQSLGDKYTTFMRPIKSKQFQTQIQGEVSGIGAQVEHLDGILTIVTPIVGSPAERAGLEPGDQVIRVDGDDLAGLSFMEAVDKVRGPQGSKVRLTIKRNGVTLEKEVIRDVIRVPEIILTWHDDKAVVKLTQFGRVTENDLRNTLSEVVSKEPKGIVLDLRNNPGGLLTTAAVVMSAFVPNGSEVVEIRTKSNRKTEVTRLEPVVPNNLKMVVLVNEGSASASEIVAGALQDHDRATIVGSKTFGKGTVQQVLQFNDQSALKMTIAEWYTPSGKKIDGEGVHPDIGVKEIDGRDAPLLKALELLR